MYLSTRNLIASGPNARETTTRLPCTTPSDRTARKSSRRRSGCRYVFRMEKVKAVVDGFTPLTGGFVPPRPPATPGGWTAPSIAPTMTVESTRVTVDLPASVDALDELVEQVEGTHGALLASVDGLGIARSSSMADEPSHAAMVAAAVGIAHQLASMGGGRNLRQLVVDHDGGLMIVWPIGSQRVLAVLAASRVDQRQLRALVQRHAGLLAGASS